MQLAASVLCRIVLPASVAGVASVHCSAIICETAFEPLSAAIRIVIVSCMDIRYVAPNVAKCALKPLITEQNATIPMKKHLRTIKGSDNV